MGGCQLNRKNKMLKTHVSLPIFFFKLGHGNHYLGNTDFALPLKVYET